MKTTPVVLIQHFITNNVGAWLSTATLRFFAWLNSATLMTKNENNPKNEHKFKYYSDLKNQDDLQN